MRKCSICLEERPEEKVVREVLEQSVEVYGMMEQLEWFEGENILIVNNYKSLLISFEDMI